MPICVKLTMESWCFNHIKTSPRYPQSNGKAENAVRTVKRLFPKCRGASKSEFAALLVGVTRPPRGLAQRLMERRCRTPLPMSTSLLQTKFPTGDDLDALARSKHRQKKFYDRGSKLLKPIKPGDSVRRRVPVQKIWSPASCVDLSGPRRYLVRAGNAVYRRNRCDVIATGNPSVFGPPCSPDLLSSSFDRCSNITSAVPLQNSTLPESPTLVALPVEPSTTVPPCASPLQSSKPAASSPVPTLRGSQRERRPPIRFRDYVVF